jgi:hypothetical protein
VIGGQRCAPPNSERSEHLDFIEREDLNSFTYALFADPGMPFRIGQLPVLFDVRGRIAVCEGLLAPTGPTWAVCKIRAKSSAAPGG